jgi:hypothetical protein
MPATRIAPARAGDGREGIALAMFVARVVIVKKNSRIGFSVENGKRRG